jgi:hypothetical protein
LRVKQYVTGSPTAAHGNMPSAARIQAPFKFPVTPASDQAYLSTAAQGHLCITANVKASGLGGGARKFVST